MNDRNENRPGYKKTKVGWIPEDWHVKIYGEVLKRTKSAVAVEPYQDYQEIGIRSHGKGIFYKTPVKGLQLGDKYVFNVHAPALIFNIVFAWEQAVAVTSERESGMIASHRFPMYTAKQGKADLYYLRYFFLTKRGKYLLELASPGGAGRNKTLGQGELYRLPLPLPSLTEQRKIAEILSMWDTAIEQTQRLLEAKKKRKKGLMQQLLWGKQRLSDFEESSVLKEHRFFPFPEDWQCPQIRKIARECSLRNKGNGDVTVLSCSKHIGFVESAKYFGKQVCSEDTSNYKVIERGCFGYPSNHIEEGSIGLLLEREKGLVSPIYIVFKCDDRVIPEYLYAVFKTDTFRHIFTISTNSSVDRRGSLRWREFSLIHVPLPTKDEQQAIAAVLLAADNEINQLEKKLRALEKQKRGLMQKLLTGEIRVAT